MFVSSEFGNMLFLRYILDAGGRGSSSEGFRPGWEGGSSGGVRPGGYLSVSSASLKGRFDERTSSVDVN